MRQFCFAGLWRYEIVMASVAVSQRPTEYQTMTRAIVAAVADVTGREPDALEPLYHTVDSDALDTLLDSGGSGADVSPMRVAFKYAGCDVEVASDGKVTASDEERETTKRWE